MTRSPAIPGASQRQIQLESSSAESPWRWQPSALVMGPVSPRRRSQPSGAQSNASGAVMASRATSASHRERSQAPDDAWLILPVLSLFCRPSRRPTEHAPSESGGSTTTLTPGPCAGRAAGAFNAYGRNRKIWRVCYAGTPGRDMRNNVRGLLRRLDAGCGPNTATELAPSCGHFLRTEMRLPVGVVGRPFRNALVRALRISSRCSRTVLFQFIIWRLTVAMLGCLFFDGLSHRTY